MTTQQLANPYFELLGIPESEFPPNRYRLLGIPPFTSNENVIRNGADRQMQFLRRVGGDKYLDDVQTILNEVAEAKIFLLNDENRSAYDEELKEFNTSGSHSGLTPLAAALQVTLTILDGVRAGKVFQFEKDRIFISANASADIQLPGAKHEYVIRQHQNQWLLESPTNMFAVNQILIEDRAVVRSGDVIRFGLAGNTLQFHFGSDQAKVSYWLEKFPHCRIDPMPEVLPDPKWKRKPSRTDRESIPAHQASPKFVKKTGEGVSFAMVIFCIVAGCSIGAIAFYLIAKYM